MNQTSLLILWLSQCVAHLPETILAVVGCVMVLLRWKLAGAGAVWALLGFALVLVLAIFVPLLQTVLQQWVVQSHYPMSQRGVILTGFSLLWSALRAISYAMLLVAIFAGRASFGPEIPPPLPR